MHIIYAKCPQVKKGDASSLLQLINHVSKHIQALSMTVPIQDLTLNNLMPATMNGGTQNGS